MLSGGKTGHLLIKGSKSATKKFKAMGFPASYKLSGCKSEVLLQLAFLVKMSYTSDLFSLRVLKKGDRWLDNLYHLACGYIWKKKRREEKRNQERQTDMSYTYLSRDASILDTDLLRQHQQYVLLNIINGNFK